MEYYIIIDNRKKGPYNINELYARGIDATTLVMPEGTMQWTPAWKINELRELLTTEESVQPTGDGRPDTGNSFGRSPSNKLVACSSY